MFEKRNTNKHQDELTYGEMTYFTLDSIFKTIQPKPNHIFYDLGSGKGKLILYSALKYSVQAIGVEIMPTYFKLAQKQAQKMGIQNATFLNTDFFAVTLTDADIVLISPTCLMDVTRQALFNKLSEMKKNSYVISVTFSIPSPDFQRVKTFKALFSWGIGTVYIFRKGK